MTEQVKAKVQHLEDDDNCSEFSVISVYDDQDDLDSVQNGSSSGLAPRMTYVDPSIHESEFADNMSVASRNQSSEQKFDPMLEDLQRSASWNPLSLSGYVSTNSVADLIDKVLIEYKQNHELLASMHSSILDLKSRKSDDGSAEKGERVSTSSSSEVEQLKAQLAAANSRIDELEKEKKDNEQHFKSAAKDAEKYIFRLESQLSEQCQMNKALREELDERMDELRLSKDELKTQRLELTNQRVIASNLQQEKEENSEQLKLVCNAYEDKMRELERTFTSYHERNEPIHSSTQTQPSVNTTSPPSLSCHLYTSNQLERSANRSSLVCHLCQCDCPTQDYYKYHLQTTHCSYKCELCNMNFVNQEEMQKHSDEVHAEPRIRLSPLQFQQADDTSNASNIDCCSPVSEFTASFVVDSAETTDSVSTAEEALSDISDEENQEMNGNVQDELEEIESSVQDTDNGSVSLMLDAENIHDEFDEDELASGFKTPYEDSCDGQISVVSSRFEAAEERGSAEFNFDVQELIRNSELVQESIMTEADVREVIKLLEANNVDVAKEENNQKNEENQSAPVIQKIEEKPVEQKPRPALQLPISQNVVQHQIFLCDCLCAFPTRGSLITHKTYCTTANS